MTKKKASNSKRKEDSEEFEEIMTADAVDVKCDCCGRMIPSKPVKKTVQGRDLEFCGNDCYELYLNYKMKK